MPMVPPELGVGAFERWVAMSLGLLDAVIESMSVLATAIWEFSSH